MSELERGVVSPRMGFGGQDGPGDRDSVASAGSISGVERKVLAKSSASLGRSAATNAASEANPLPLFLARPGEDGPEGEERLLLALVQQRRQRAQKVAIAAWLLAFVATGAAATILVRHRDGSSAQAAIAVLAAEGERPSVASTDADRPGWLDVDLLRRAAHQWRPAPTGCSFDMPSEEGSARNRAGQVALALNEAPNAPPLPLPAKMVLQIAVGDENARVVQLPLKLARLGAEAHAGGERLELRGAPASWTVTPGPTGVLYLLAGSALLDQRDAFELLLIDRDGRTISQLAMRFDFTPLAAKAATPRPIGARSEDTAKPVPTADWASEKGSHVPTSLGGRARIGSAGAAGRGARQGLGGPSLLEPSLGKAGKDGEVSGAPGTSSGDSRWTDGLFLGRATP